MGRKKRGDDFLDLPDPDEEGGEAAVAEEGAAKVCLVLQTKCLCCKSRM
jgi:hypothetical protein